MDAYLMPLAILFSVPLALCGLLVPFLLIIPNHAHDMSWPMHARFHVVWGACKLFALGITQSLLIAYPFAGQERWSWFAMAANLLFGGMSIGAASHIAQGPVPPWHVHDRSSKLMIICLLSAMLGLAFAVRPVFFGR